MTLENKVLQSLSDWHPAPGRQHLTIPDAGAGWAVDLAADRCDELGILLWDMTLRRTQPAPDRDTASPMTAWKRWRSG